MAKCRTGVRMFECSGFYALCRSCMTSLSGFLDVYESLAIDCKSTIRSTGGLCKGFTIFLIYSVTCGCVRPSHEPTANVSV